MIYLVLLGDDFARLPAALRALHGATGRRCAEGTMSIRRENGMLAWLVGFPPAGDNVPVKLEIDGTDREETWTRWFGGMRRTSTQRLEDGLLIERAGPVRILFRVRASDSGMRFESQRTQVFGIPVLLRIAASVRGGETSWEVEVRFEHVGSYRGVMTLKP
jgi:hypothetical protein